SYVTLPPPKASLDPARIFRLLGLLRMATLTLPAIAALADQPAGEVAVALEILTNVHMLESPAPARFRLHDLLRSYAAELARERDSAEERRDALRRVLRWYGDRILAVARTLDPAVLVTAPAIDPAQARGWAEAERVNLLAA